MLKQQYPKEIFKILGIKWEEDENTSTGSTVTKNAWEKVYNKLIELQGKGLLKSE